MQLVISISDQTLTLKQEGDASLSFPISSAKRGIGSAEGSYKTPTGNFLICEKFGHNAPIYTTFKARQASGMWSTEDVSDDDLITSRILWLEGIDPGNSNTKERFIYIHGTNHEDKIGAPHSCGCIRMNNRDIIELFEKVGVGTAVQIIP